MINLIGGIAARLAGHLPVVWGIHHTNLDPRQNKRHTIWTAQVCARLSHAIPNGIVCCSETSRQVHAGLGYVGADGMQQRGGLDKVPVSLQRMEARRHADQWSFLRYPEFPPERSPRLRMRAKLAQVKTVGDRTLRALWEGRGPEKCRADGLDSSGRAGLGDVCHLLGVREDMPRFFAAIDIATSPSVSEAFPNAIGEAMACGTPCVVTNVGDSAALVGDTGKVVPAGSPNALAEAWRELLTSGPAVREQLGALARTRVEQHFSLGSVVERYQETYRQILAVLPKLKPKNTATWKMAS